jgi:hypothetical protein
MAGMPHNDSRENPTYDPNPCKMPVTRFPVGSMMAMGLHHVGAVGGYRDGAASRRPHAGAERRRS